MHVYISCVWRLLDGLELQLAMYVSHHVGVGDQTQVVQNCSQCS